MTITEMVQKIADKFGTQVSAPVHFRGETTLQIQDPQKIAEVCRYAKQDLGFDFLVDISSVDNLGVEPRFSVVYELYGHQHRQHLRLKVDVSEEHASLPSVVSIWRGADWQEREVFDMMGIRFEGHPDLRRLLMWEGFSDFPLRKDFPLGGKSTSLPEVAFTEAAPLEGGPFVTLAGGEDTIAREPRARTSEGNP